MHVHMSDANIGYSLTYYNIDLLLGKVSHSIALCVCNPTTWGSSRLSTIPHYNNYAQLLLA